MKKPFFAALCFLSALHTGAQVNYPCSTDESVKKLFIERPVLSRNWQQIEALAEYYKNEQGSSAMANGNVVTIPVVFHVVWNTPQQNISLAQLQSQLDVLNEDFRRLNADTFKTKTIFKPVAGDARIQFCLASRAPNGDTTSGFTRTQTVKTSFGCTDSVKFTAYGGKDGWPGAKYLNIWVCNLNCANGYAYYPGTSDPYDGVVLHYYITGRVGYVAPGYRGRTGTHEVGHWLGLYHTFEYAVCNGTTQSTCAGGGDKICDTPASNYPNYGCASYTNSCVDVPTDLQNQTENYMDYSNDTCKNMFSKGQVDRMRSMLFSYRIGLVTSLGCVPSGISYTDAVMVDVTDPASYGCSGFITPGIKIGNAGTGNISSLGISYQVDANPTQTLTWTGTLSSGSLVTVTLPTVAVSSGNHTLSISLFNPNNGTDQNLNNNAMTHTFTELPAGPGLSLPLVEGLEGTSFAPGGWTIYNPDGDRKWEKTSDASGFGLSSACAVFRNFYNGSTNKKDGLITPPYDLSNGMPLGFRVAYCQPGSPFYSDTLKVWASTNCGINWTLIYAKGGNTLATAPQPTVFSEFVPGPAQWRQETVSLTSLAGNQKVSFKFENTSFWGNNLYLDDINILSPTGIEAKLQESGHLFYDPDNATLNLITSSQELTVNSATVTDLSGRVVAGGEFVNGKITLRDLKPGYYIALMETDQHKRIVRRFIKTN
jgi:hypothetical protein